MTIEKAYCPSCHKSTQHTIEDDGVKNCVICGAYGKTIQERAQGNIRKGKQ